MMVRLVGMLSLFMALSVLSTFSVRSAPIDVNSVIKNYYLHPDPKVIPELIRALDEQQIKQTSLSPLTGFLSEVLRASPTTAQTLVEMQELSDPLYVLIGMSIHTAELPNEKQLLDRLYLHKKVDDRARLEAIPIIPLLEMPLTSATLDRLWGAFMASGNPDYVKRIISALNQAHHPNKSIEDQLLASAAQWSLTSNAEQHPRVLAICKASLKSDILLPASQVDLKKLIDKAENRGQTQ